MDLLVIGGTRFLGRHLVQSAIGRGHKLTLFNRGQSAPGMFAVEEIHGNRDGDIGRLGDRRWDAVVDTCGFFPRVVEQSARFLESRVGRYCFISSISVYASGEPTPTQEESKVVRFESLPEKEEITAESYGGFKVLCEDTVVREFGPERSLIIRPGLIVGPYDPSDRFTYWVDRFGRSDSILIPNRPNEPVQVIDVRDLADFILNLLEQQISGVFNVTGPDAPMTVGDFWTACRCSCGGNPTEVVVSNEFLSDNGVEEWSDMPLMLPLDGDKLDASIDRALAAGLQMRPIEQTLRDTANWHGTRGDVQLKAGLTRERELDLIEQWRRR